MYTSATVTDPIYSGGIGDGVTDGGIGAIAGQAGTPVNCLATFNDPDTTQTFTATINWGDGSSTVPATVTTDGNGDYFVNASYTYNDASTYPVTVTLSGTDENGNAISASQSTNAIITDDAINATGFSITPIVDQAYTGPIASFSDTSGIDLSQLNATIDWGDGGPTSTGYLVADPNNAGTFDVYESPDTANGPHVYSAGQYTINVSLDGLEAFVVAVTSNATIADADIEPYGIDSIADTTWGQDATVTAAFSDVDPGLSAGDFTPNIDWGEGGGAVPATVSDSTAFTGVAGMPGVYSVTGDNVYGDAGNYTVTVTVSYDGVESKVQCILSVGACVDAGSSTTTLTANQSTTSYATQDLSFTATVNGAPSCGDEVILEDASNGYTQVASAQLYGPQVDFIVPAGTLSVGTHDLVAVYTGNVDASPSQSNVITQTVTAAPMVNGEYLFYSGSSAFDGGATSPSSNDYNAIATDKSALLPGNTGSFNNVSSYYEGINGILVDFGNMAAGTVLSASDFQFNVDSMNSPNTWTAGPAPASVATWIGPNGDTFADIVWANNAIENQWLQVTVLADSNTGLAADDVFYYGSMMGATGATLNTTANGTYLRVGPADASGTQNAVGPARVAITNLYDFAHAGRVTPGDVSFVQSLVGPAGLLFISPDAS